MGKVKAKAQKDQTTTSSEGSSEKPKRKVSHAGARAKGLAFERWVADKLGGIFPDAQRKLEFQTSKGGGVDLDDTGIFKFQCKNYQNYVSISTIEEVKVTSHHDIPVLVTKGNKQPPMAVLPFDKFVYLLSIVYGLEAPLALIQPEGLERFVEAIAGTLPDPGLIKLVNHDALRVAWEETKSPTGNYLDSLI